MMHPQTRRQPSLALAALLLALILAALACNAGFGRTPAPTTPPEPPPPQDADAPAPEEAGQEAEQPPAVEPPPADEASGASIACESLSFTLDPAVASGVSGQVVPAEDFGDEGPFWAEFPEHVECLLTGYALSGTFHEPRLYVWPVAEYEALNPDASGMFGDMEQLLAEKPAAPDSIPFLPFFNAAQMMRSNVAYLDFQNGSGVRFVTQYGQDISPINNQNAFYTFQGMTADGSLWVSAILPISHPTLAASWEDVPGGDWDAFAAAYESYIAGVVQQLNAQPDESFTPTLTQLDGLVRSISAAP